MRHKDETEPEVIINTIRLGRIDFDSLERDYCWSEIRCVGWRERNQIVKRLKPTGGIYSIKSEDYESNSIYVMSKITTEELQNILLAEFGREKLRELCTIGRMQRSAMEPHRVFQLLINSLGKQSLLKESNAEGHYYKVVQLKQTNDVPKPYYGQLTVMEIVASRVPESLEQFGDVKIEFPVKYLNNTLRKALGFDPKSWRYPVFRLTDGDRIEVGPCVADGYTFTAKSVYGQKAHLDLLNWNPSKGEANLKHSRSVIVFEIIERLKARFGRYFEDMSFARFNGEVIRDDIKQIYHDRMIDHFKRREVRIYNCTGQENKEAVDEFVKAVESLYELKVIRANGPAMDGYNVPIIFRDDHYKDNKLPDPHKRPPIGLMQHITIDVVMDVLEDYRKKLKKHQTKLEKYNLKKMEWEADTANKGKKYSAVPPTPISIPEIEVIFEQLFIKEDVTNSVVSFYHWSEEGYAGNWTFAKPFFFKPEQSRKMVLRGFGVITIAPEGNILDIRFFNPSDPFAPSKLSRLDWDKLCYAVINPEGELNTVTNTGVKTLADGQAFLRLIEENNRKIKEYDEMTEGWTAEQIEADSENRPHRAEGVTTWETKMKMMGGCIGIGFHKLSDKSWLYYIGPQNNPNQVIANSSFVYLVEAVGDSELFFDDIFPMMAVPFIRHKQNAVIPFPVKYLNEWYELYVKSKEE